MKVRIMKYFKIRIYLCFLFLIFGFISACSVSKQAAQRRPNIILIVADDMGFGDPQCYNSDSKIPTPNMNELAKKGVIFTNAHSSSALCTPSRYSILTGVYSWRSKLKKGVIFDYSSPLIDKGVPTVATFLKQNGYKTAAFGKWHLGFDWKTTEGEETPFQVSSLHIKNIDFDRQFENGPLDHGFDYYFGIPGSNDMGPYLYIENRNIVGDPNIWATKENFPLMRGKKETWLAADYKLSEIDSMFTEKAKNFIGKQDKDEPFFMYFCASAPHFPYDPPNYARGKSNAGGRGDMVYAFDHNIGKLIKILKEKGLYENSIIIVTSDNGPLPGDPPSGKNPGHGMFESYGHQSAGSFRGIKGNIFEGGHRVPLIISGPLNARKNTKIDNQVCLVDIFGLVGQIIQNDLPKQALDSYGFLPLISGSGFQRPEPIINYARGVFAVQDFDGWKYIHENQLGGGIYSWNEHGISADPIGPISGSDGLLYDLGNDISEEKNLFHQKKEKVAELSEIIQKVINKQE